MTAASELEGLDVIKHDEPAYAFGISMFSVIVKTLTQLIFQAQSRRTLAHKVAFNQLGTIFKKHPTLDFCTGILQDSQKFNNKRETNTCFYTVKFYKNSINNCKKKFRFSIKFSYCPKLAKEQPKIGQIGKIRHREMSKCLTSVNVGTASSLHCMILRGCVSTSQLLRSGLKTHSRVQRLFFAAKPTESNRIGHYALGALVRNVNITLNPFHSGNSQGQRRLTKPEYLPLSPLIKKHKGSGWAEI